MVGSMRGGYFPQYPHHDNLPDPEIRTFITNFYHATDQPGSDELWISYFTPDAHVVIGGDVGHGEQEIRELRQRMWTTVRERRHTVKKAFPAIFQDPADVRGDECELMLFGEVNLETTDGQSLVVPWAGHAVVKKEVDAVTKEWKFTQYQVWMQNS
ncbi:hypothetical protein ACRE_001310 [Hapsidospora chrysogenum ATCC 11550]|uniref:SnoaL-like domain-containing protein n=1 Tax=Hapsidospora chrysogenum (strain ATCC 11550 / CBS 779.69 / DSM 880 / IAM 14645 / JCM 23072 / IMI 49137) TaxID=857340 RepID=A0A086THU3_HAPC1|nr:hypothetical protein ACRE_001310 [Hapsidospora chrysogenum ATCC 11550]